MCSSVHNKMLFTFCVLKAAYRLQRQWLKYLISFKEQLHLIHCSNCVGNQGNLFLPQQTCAPLLAVKAFYCCEVWSLVVTTIYLIDDLISIFDFIHWLMYPPSITCLLKGTGKKVTVKNLVDMCCSSFTFLQWTWLFPTFWVEKIPQIRFHDSVKTRSTHQHKWISSLFWVWKINPKPQ